MKKIIFFILFGVSALTACKMRKQSGSAQSLTGQWELNYITGPRITFDGLFPDKKPIINFKENAQEISGNASCNGFSSKITLKGNKLTIAAPGPMTMMYCEGGGEKVFLDMLKKVDSYQVEAQTLTMLQGDLPLMRFTKK